MRGGGGCTIALDEQGRGGITYSGLFALFMVLMVGVGCIASITRQRKNKLMRRYLFSLLISLGSCSGGDVTRWYHGPTSVSLDDDASGLAVKIKEKLIFRVDTEGQEDEQTRLARFTISIWQDKIEKTYLVIFDKLAGASFEVEPCKVCVFNAGKDITVEIEDGMTVNLGATFILTGDDLSATVSFTNSTNLKSIALTNIIDD